jgi:hypothetical protein
VVVASTLSLSAIPRPGVYKSVGVFYPFGQVATTVSLSSDCLVLTTLQPSLSRPRY